MSPYDWANSGTVDVFLHGKYGFNSMGEWCYSREWVLDVQGQNMLHCFREVKCQQGFTAGILYLVYNVLG